MHSMKNYQKGGAGGRREDRGGRSSFKPGFKNRNEDRGGFRNEDRGNSRNEERGNSREVVTHKAVCSECRKGCEVPFRPSNDKPVYCRDCFSAKRDRETKEYHASIGRGTDVKKFSQDRPSTKPETLRHENTVTVAPGNETKKQLAELSARIDKLASAFDKLMASIPSQVVTTPRVTKTPVVKTSVTKTTSPVVKKVAAPALPSKKVVAKVIAKKTVAVKKVATVKKVVAKVAPKKAVVVKKTAVKAVKKVVAKKTK
jgi:CxxC-x17-CxxC domain-containing protein